jgi:hypothetical protein
MLKNIVRIDKIDYNIYIKFATVKMAVFGKTKKFKNAALCRARVGASTLGLGDVRPISLAVAA